MAADLADGAPRTPVGQVVRGLQGRRAAGVDAPLAVVSCDNLPGNGGLLRTLVADFAGRAGGPAGLADWIEATPTSRRRWSTASCRPPRPRPRRRVRADRRDRRCAGGGRAVHPVGDRGRLPRGAPGLGVRRRPAGGRRAPVRDDEAAAGQRRSLGARVPRPAGRPRDDGGGDGRPRARRLRARGDRHGVSPQRSPRSPASTSATTGARSSSASPTRASPTAWSRSPPRARASCPCACSTRRASTWPPGASPPGSASRWRPGCAGSPPRSRATSCTPGSPRRRRRAGPGRGRRARARRSRRVRGRPPGVGRVPGAADRRARAAGGRRGARRAAGVRAAARSRLPRLRQHPMPPTAPDPQPRHEARGRARRRS